MNALPKELSDIQEQVKQLASDYKLSPFPVEFEMVDYEQMCALAARGGFPVRYPHWRFGMEYDHLSKSYEYGLSKIYEMVINANPCVAYLLNANPLTDQKLVMAHVYGHSDFFRNNLWFSKTNRDMVNEMANHATRIRRYMDRFGVDVVENFLDAALTLENLIDPFAPFQGPQASKHSQEPSAEPTRFKVPAYMDKYVNPPELLEQERQTKIAKLESEKHRLPAKPQRDVLKFLMEQAPLDAWKQDVISILREEAYYFAPQPQTKMMNEGWAAYWHSLFMTRHLLNASEVITYADHHASALAMQPTGPINPYKIGIELFRDIEDRWNRGAFGAEYEACQSFEEKQRWNRETGLGRTKMFEVRQVCNDISFISNYLTEEFCLKHRLFVFSQNTKNQRYEVISRAFQDVKKLLLFSLTNLGQPIVDVVDGNYRKRRELLLRHRYEDHELDLKKAEQTLRNLHRIWDNPVHIATQIQGQDVTCTFDGETFVIHGLPEKSGTEPKI
jgi:stage V sporulation protein R